MSRPLDHVIIQSSVSPPPMMATLKFRFLFTPQRWVLPTLQSWSQFSQFLAGATSRPCIIYAHGGGCVGGSADLYRNYLSYMALTCGVVVFNVDYRLAPEARFKHIEPPDFTFRCPNNVLDFYEAIKYVISNASKFGVDASRIAIAGKIFVWIFKTLCNVEGSWSTLLFSWLETVGN